MPVIKIGMLLNGSGVKGGGIISIVKGEFPMCIHNILEYFPNQIEYYIMYDCWWKLLHTYLCIYIHLVARTLSLSLKLIQINCAPRLNIEYWKCNFPMTRWVGWSVSLSVIISYTHRCDPDPWIFLCRIRFQVKNEFRIQSPLSWKVFIYFMSIFKKKLFSFIFFDDPQSWF